MRKRECTKSHNASVTTCHLYNLILFFFIITKPFLNPNSSLVYFSIHQTSPTLLLSYISPLWPPLISPSAQPLSDHPPPFATTNHLTHIKPRTPSGGPRSSAGPANQTTLIPPISQLKLMPSQTLSRLNLGSLQGVLRKRKLKS